MKQTDEQLAKILEKGLNVATKTGDFIIEQAPDLIQQLLLYKTVEAVFCSILFTTLNYFTFKVMKKDYERHDDLFDANPVILVGGTCVLIVSFVGSMNYISDLVKLIFAPKIYLIEYVSHLIK